jgi:hypothetical protein
MKLVKKEVHGHMKAKKVIKISSLGEFMVIFLAVSLEGQPSTQLYFDTFHNIYVMSGIQELTRQVMT